MRLIIILIIIAALLFALINIYAIYKNQIHFFIEGLNQGFSIFEIQTLWDCAIICSVEEPISLFISLQTLSKCISQIMSKLNEKEDIKLRNLLKKLYDFRAKIDKETDKKRGLDSTMALNVEQKIRVILPGKGVFVSEILNNTSKIIISLPTVDNRITVGAKDWIGQTVSVYLWRAGDARYVFDTVVESDGLFLGKPCISLRHTTNLIRTQKRNAVRVQCHIHADLYIMWDENIDFNKVETKPGYKCILEDISDHGALIRIGGKGASNTKIRLQFQIENKLVIMFGMVRSVQYDEATNQSKLHFECIHIDDAMRTLVLSYVYNTLPQSEKEIIDAIKYTEEDAKAEEKENENSETVLGQTDSELKNTAPPEQASQIPETDTTQNDAQNTAQDDTQEQNVENGQDNNIQDTTTESNSQENSENAENVLEDFPEFEEANVSA